MLLAVIVAVLLQQPDPAGGGLYYGYIDGMRWTFTVRPADIVRSPVWAENEASPPLPPRAAIRSARELLRKYYPRADDWPLHQVSLQPILGKPDAWIYVVEFIKPLLPPRSGQRGGVVGSILGGSLSIVVLMDGTAVTPVRTPWSPGRRP